MFNANNRTFYNWIYFFLLIAIYISIIYLIYQSIIILHWRYHNITLPLYKMLFVDRYFFTKIQVACASKGLPHYMYNGYIVFRNLSYLTICILSLFLIHLIVSFYYNNRWALKHSIFLFLIFIFLIFFFYDFQIFHWVRDFDIWLVKNGYPSFHLNFPQFKQFFNHDYDQFRVILGYGDMFSYPASLQDLQFTGYDFTLCDKANKWGLHGLDNYQMACKIRHDFMQYLFPSILDTLKYKNDLNLYFKTFGITEVPYASISESYYAILNFFSYLFNYSLGLSLASIVFVITIILTLLYSLSFITSINHKYNEKFSPYECGFEPIHTNARIKFDVLYWIIGILYLIFDLELIFIFPLATILHTLQNPIALLAYLIFMIILTLGFIYEWKKGALKLNL